MTKIRGSKSTPTRTPEKTLRVIIHRLASPVTTRYNTRRLSVVLNHFNPALTNISLNSPPAVRLSVNLIQSPLVQSPPRRPIPTPTLVAPIPVQQLPPVRLVRTCESALNITPDLLETTTNENFHDLGSLTFSCSHCGALFFIRERRNRNNKILLCCNDGKVKIPTVSTPPDDLRALFIEDNHLAVEFRNNIRVINSLFAMATFKTSGETFIPPTGRSGLWFFSISGQIYHHYNGIPNDRDLDTPNINHYYFLDANDAIQKRSSFLDNRVSEILVSKIEQILRRDNVFIRSYSTVSEQLNYLIREHDIQKQDLVIAFADNMSEFLDKSIQTVHTIPQGRDEIAAIFLGEPPVEVNLKLYPRSDIDPLANSSNDPDLNIPNNDNNPDNDDNRDIPRRMHEIKNLNSYADPMVYPILFPFGDRGYSPNILLHVNRENEREPDNNDNDNDPDDNEPNQYRVKHRKFVTLSQFYTYRVMTRTGFSILHNGGKLFQQYLVDSWCKSEASQLWYIRNINSQFRTAKQKVLAKIKTRYENQGNAPLPANFQNDLQNIGRIAVLPASFTSSPRHEYRIYLEAMTIVARHGKPDIFITFTCNSSWPEIQSNLNEKQKACHRPDLVCRVFNAKFDDLLIQIKDRQIFGAVRNYFYTIEFQKRGLPHAHLLVTLHDNFKPNTVEKVDRIISASFPEPNIQPSLFALVSQHQIHRPCGQLNLNAPCTSKEGLCNKFYPKNFCDTTNFGSGSNRRPEYRRPNDNRACFISGHRCDNSRVVPYNPYLLARYKCHINVELCGSLASMKYLHKYVTKGVDFCTLGASLAPTSAPTTANLVIDEIKDYVNCRYVGAMEATWRLFAFKLHGRSHSTLTLPVHLPNEAYSAYDYTLDVQGIQTVLERKTKLEAFFILNETDPSARIYRYVDIPEHYVWDSRSTSWKPRRKQQRQIGSIVTVSSTANELFFLRMLLRHRSGARSFDDLKTVNGILFLTFHDACRALGLLTTENDISATMEECILLHSPSRLRQLFATLCSVAECPPVTLADLWTKYKRYFVEDILKRHPHLSYQEALYEASKIIDSILQRMRNDSSISLVSLGCVIFDPNNDGHVEDTIRSELAIANPSSLVSANEQDIDPLKDCADLNTYQSFVENFNINSFNADQLHAYLLVLRSVTTLLGKEDIFGFHLNTHDDHDFLRSILATLPATDTVSNVFYLDGPGGTGKTFLYNNLILSLRHVFGVNSIAVAWTGIAACLLINGQTAHRAFKIPLTLSDTSKAGFDMESHETQTIRKSGLILWDEAPMSNRFAVEAVNRYLQEVMGNFDKPFGGKHIIFGGDFRQILPVVPRGNRSAILEISLIRTPFWNKVYRLSLVKNMRATLRPTASVTFNTNKTHTKTHKPLPVTLPWSDYLLTIGEFSRQYAPVLSRNPPH